MLKTTAATNPEKQPARPADWHAQRTHPAAQPCVQGAAWCGHEHSDQSVDWGRGKWPHFMGPFYIIQLQAVRKMSENNLNKMGLKNTFNLFCY